MSNLPTMFEPPPVSDPDSVLNDYIQPNLGHALRIWWAYYWPTMVISFLLGVLLRGVVRLLYENFILSANPLLPVLTYGPYVINYVIAFFMIRYVLGKTFRHFRLGLISNADVPPAQLLKPTFTRTLRVWWIFTWRTVVYGLLCLAFVLYPMQWFVGIFRPSPLFSTLFFWVLGTAVGGAIALFVIYSNLLDEDVGDFRVVLLPRQDAVPASSSLASDPAPLG
ncbi:MAG: hypothetical protein WCE61_18375 [Candidatus Acidiferrum sp.]